MEPNAIYVGDCMDLLKEVPDDSVDLIVTDPPYGWKFMQKDWDRAIPPIGVWEECLRVLKPGAFAFVMSGPRQDCLSRMIVNLEDAGFNVSFSPIYHTFACLSDDTEVLTHAGWERVRTYTKGLKKPAVSDTIIGVNKTFSEKEILTYDPETAMYQWEIPEKWSAYRISNTCYRIESDSTSQLVTQRHRCYVKRAGRLLWDFAEGLSPMEEFPILENLRSLREDSFPTREEFEIFCGLLEGMPDSSPAAKEGQAIRGTRTKSREDMPNLWQGISGKRERASIPEREILLSQLQGKGDYSQSLGIRQAYPPHECGAKREVTEIHDGKQEQGMEGRSNIFQKAWQLCKREICSLSERISGYGPQRRLCYGTQTFSGSGTWQTPYQNRSSPPFRPRPYQQSNRESGSLFIQQRSQTTRTRPPYQTTLATVRQVPYNGIVFCPTVSTGCFVARRKGKIFLTGNSGFPKAANVGKLVDKRLGIDRRVVGKKGGRYSYDASKMAASPMGNVDPRHNMDWEEVGNITLPASEESKSLDGSYTFSLKPALEVVLVVQKPFEAKYKRSDVYGILGGRYDYWYTQATKVTERNKATLEEQWERAFQDGDVIERRLALRPDLNDEVIVNRLPGCCSDILWSKPYTNSDLTSTVTHALETGKGIVWLEDGRIPYSGQRDAKVAASKNRHLDFGSGARDNKIFGTDNRSRAEQGNYDVSKGRFPANLLVSDDVLNDGTITKGGKGFVKKKKADNVRMGGDKYGEYPPPIDGPNYPDSGSFSRYFSLDAWWAERIKQLPESVQKTFPFMIVPKPSKSEKNKGLDALPEVQMYKCDGSGQSLEIFGTTNGGRKPRQNHHPTVKAVKLMSYLITIGSREGDTVLDPYCGTATTGVAAAALNRYFIGFELNGEYAEIARLRYEAAIAEIAREKEESSRQLDWVDDDTRKR